MGKGRALPRCISETTGCEQAGCCPCGSIEVHVYLTVSHRDSTKPTHYLVPEPPKWVATLLACPGAEVTQSKQMPAAQASKEDSRGRTTSKCLLCPITSSCCPSS